MDDGWKGELKGACIVGNVDYAATTRHQIVQYLKDGKGGKVTMIVRRRRHE